MEHERGSSMVGYALVMVLVGVTAVTGMTTMGASTSSAFTAVSDEMRSESAGEDAAVDEDTDLSAWETAQAEYDAAMRAARAERDAALVAAEQDRDAGRAANEGLPKGLRTAADAQVDAAYTQAKAAASRRYEQATGAARDARDAAQAAYLAQSG